MKKHISTLKKILNKAYISPMLNTAIEDTIQALEAKDLNLAYLLTACKSHIMGQLEPKNKQYAFQENQNYNKAQLKNSVYSLLDTIHHDIARKIYEVPSGMVAVGVFKGNIRAQKMKLSGNHPVVKRIKFEHDRNKRQFAGCAFQYIP
jgi:hypothetical protein